MAKKTQTWEAGFAREIITPARGVALAGYFQPRPNRGALDELSVKAAVFRSGRTVAGIVHLDLIFVTGDIVRRVRERLRRRGARFADNISFSATHTHTGPYVTDLFHVAMDRSYVRMVVARIVTAIERARACLAPVTLHCGSVRNNPYAFNRRFFMKGGQVATNPGKQNPDIVRPEGPVDDEIGVLAVRQGDRTVGLIVNVVNHGDTVGGDLVSADWHGRLERAMQTHLGCDCPVLVLVGCSGNINHFDVSRSGRQGGYAEAKRIGRGYAEIIAGMLENLRAIPPGRLAVRRRQVRIRYRTIPEEQVRQARALLKAGETGAAGTGGSLTSEGLAGKNLTVRRMFAKQLLQFRRRKAGKSDVYELMAVTFGRGLAISTLPGEPFTEIGMRIKQHSPFRNTFVAAVSNGTCGYVPLPECFERGGYETMPVMSGGAAETTADLLISKSVGMLGVPRAAR